VRVVLAVTSEAVAPALATYLIGAGAQIYALAPRRLSLEELFMRVMQEET
jgi:hypothetical protein